MHIFRESCSWLIGQTLAAYIVRGVLGIGLFTAGFMLLTSNPVLGAVLIFSALVPIGGCPACWLGGTIGAPCAYKPPRAIAATSVTFRAFAAAVTYSDNSARRRLRA